MRLLLVQNGLNITSGHWLRETDQWHEAARKLSLEWLGFSHIDFDKGLAKAHAVQPVFPYRPRDYFIPFNDETYRASLVQIPAAFAKTCTAYFPKDISGNDLLFVANATEKEIFGAAQWLATLPENQRPLTALFFHHEDNAWQIDAEKSSVDGLLTPWQQAAQALSRQLPAHKFRLYAANMLFAATLTKILNTPVYFLPLALKPGTSAPIPDTERKYDIAIIGGARDEQGITLGVAAMAGLASLRPGLKAMVQVSKKTPHHAAPLANTGIAIHYGQLIDTEFDAQLAQCRFIFQPYMPDRYYLRESGVFCEAAMAAIPVAASNFTSMSRHIQGERASGIVFNYTDSPAAIASQLNAALDNTENFRQKAAQLQDHWKTRHSAPVILQKILNDFKTAAAP